MWEQTTLVIGAYVLGSMPFLYLLGKLRGVDLHAAEDAHAALWRKAGPAIGLLGVSTDFAKGVIVILAARALGFDVLWVSIAGVVAVAGQMWPVFNGFDGGKGNTTGLAMGGTLATLPFCIALIPIAAGALIRTIPRLKKQTAKERMSLGGPPSLSLPLGVFTGFAALPIITRAFSYSHEIVFAFVALFLILMARRLTAGLTREPGQTKNKRAMLVNRLLFDRGQI